MRKTSVDIPAMIAEGCGKPGDGELAKSIGAALAVATRLEYFALMAADLEFLGTETHREFEAELIEIKKMLNGFNRRLSK